eukprot:5247391-Alexandrium_andersonii.AAC.1
MSTTAPCQLNLMVFGTALKKDSEKFPETRRCNELTAAEEVRKRLLTTFGPREIHAGLEQVPQVQRVLIIGAAIRSQFIGMEALPISSLRAY